ncbi:MULTISPECIES: T9SS type A sorting domain-containing protein [Aequorivita]|uniref:T9SS type A sorting domain-containing protein n=1 Tax=Aequorivita iocasae TaxID=2803865 RepID=A0ABX7DVV7_9FLAO|nr:MULTISPECIES: T9SS type A sorting domain-containing protein [Aequorivita]QQX77723.1 T9SS type A sorting domain-containing protein [Aequorivita iocasae]UCA57221.1 T9SS type A sorting domain-containing protein [Aequorivita sp. F7]
MKALLLFLAGILCFVSYAQDGSLDISFGDGGIVVMDIENSHDMGWYLAQQADGKIIVSGATSPDTNNFYSILVRYLPDGTLDTSFGTNGVVTQDYVSWYGDQGFLSIDNTGNIITAGVVYQNSNTYFIIARYLENGQLDYSFGTDGIVSFQGVYNIILLSDGSFLLLLFTASDEISISHYLNDGTLDVLFGTNGTAVSTFSGESFRIRETKVDGQENIFLLGTRDNNANSDIILMKFQPSGYLDSNFGNNGVVTKNIDALNPMNFSSASLDFTPDGKPVIAGSCGACVDLFEPVMQPFFIRYLNDGSPDSSFGNNGTILLPVSGFSISQLFVQENQSMIVSGRLLDCFEGSIYVVNRYFEGGFIDNSFNGASLEFDYYQTILQQDGKILSVGNTYWYDGQEDIVLLRHNNNPLSVPEFQNQIATIYPNPSNGIFTLNYELFSEKIPYQISDITGKVIATGELTEKQSQLDLSSAQNGVYFLKTNNRVFKLLKD